MSGPHVKNRVKETSTSTGETTMVLLGAPTGYKTFSSEVGNGNTCYYLIAHENGSEWEIGRGTVSAGTLDRNVVESSSNADGLVTFTAGLKTIACVLPASKIENATGTVTQVSTGTGLTGGPITTTGTVSLANTAVTPGSYTNSNITVDAQGRITAAANGSSGAGQRSSIAVVFDGGGSSIPASQRINVLVPFAFNIVAAYLLADTTGDIGISVYADTYGGTYPPSSLISSGFSMSSNDKFSDTTLSGWGVNQSADTVLSFFTDETPVSITRCTVVLVVERA